VEKNSCRNIIRKVADDANAFVTKLEIVQVELEDIVLVDVHIVVVAVLMSKVLG